MEISEVGAKIERSFKNGNGTLIVGIVFVVLFVIVYITQSKEKSSDSVSVTGAYASYPDAVTNADVVISSVQNSIDYQTEQLKNELEEQYTGTQDILDKHFTATENYIQEGQQKTEELFDKVDAMQDTMTSNFEALSSKVNTGNSSPVYGPSYDNEQSAIQKHLNALKNDPATGNFVTSNGLTVYQNASLLGTTYKGSTVTGVSTTGDGKTIISTKDGNKYTL